jgi:PAS domain S-box-containing protein
MNMKTLRIPDRSHFAEISELRQRLAAAEETLEAIRNGAVDALVVSGSKGDQVFTLTSAEKPYRLLIEAMNEGALNVLSNGTILYCNSRFAEMVKTPIEKVMGASLTQFIEARQLSLLKEMLRSLPPSGAKAEFNLAEANHDGLAVPALLSLRPLDVDGARVISIVATDLSDRKRHEEWLRHQNAELERRVAERTAELTQANEDLQVAKAKLTEDAHNLEKVIAQRTVALQESVNSLEQFCYTIAHDLRAPLRTMHGFSSALLEDFAPSLDKTAHDYARRIVGAAARMDEQIRALLVYGRLNSADMPLVETDLTAMFEQLRQTEEFRTAQIEVQQPLPKILANPTALRQVLENLVANAIKFVAPGVTSKLQISAEANAEWVRVSIQDNGIGIDSKYHQRIFRVFERAASNNYPGTGIGLAIVQKGVERMGGKVGVESAPGKGSRFWLDLRKPPTNPG